MTGTGFILVYITASNEEEANTISSLLLENKLVACTNIITGMQSSYFWQGKLETSKEVILIAKTRKDLFPLLEQKVKDNHSYECPCILALPIISGSGEYLGWISDATA